jgi:hypothetical protein
MTSTKGRTFGLVNETEYDTTTIKRIIAAACRAVAKTEGARDLSRTKFTVVYARTRDASGYAYLGDKEECRLGHASRLRIKKASKAWPAPTQGRLLRLAYHEAMHLWGHHHGEFRDLDTREARLAIWPAAAEPLPLQRKPAPKPKPTPEQARAQRIAAVEARLKTWRTKAKRADTAIKTLTRQHRGLVRAQAKAATLPLAMAAEPSQLITPADTSTHTEGPPHA